MLISLFYIVLWLFQYSSTWQYTIVFFFFSLRRNRSRTRSRSRTRTPEKEKEKDKEKSSAADPATKTPDSPVLPGPQSIKQNPNTASVDENIKTSEADIKEKYVAGIQFVMHFYTRCICLPTEICVDK